MIVSDFLFVSKSQSPITSLYILDHFVFRVNGYKNKQMEN